MGHCDHEGLSSLSRQCPPAPVNDCPRNEERNLVILLIKQQLDSVEGRLGVGGVKDGLHQQDVRPSVQQGSGLGGVGVNKLIKG